MDGTILSHLTCGVYWKDSVRMQRSSSWNGERHGVFIFMIIVFPDRVVRETDLNSKPLSYTNQIGRSGEIQSYDWLAGAVDL
jgi:hypothetical protein